ncbi:MAG: oligosaccharide flippase family protein, partial [Bacteroidaceae bacterium]|nr:oligosaccharide flippase family protein [Bacteroidaceae bacterium]
MNQLKAGAVLNYTVIILNILVGLLYTPYMLHRLGQSEYGLYSLVASVIAYLTILDLGLGNAVVRYTARYRSEGRGEEQYELFGMFLVLYLGIGVLALVAGGVFMAHFDTWFGHTMTLYELERARQMMLLLVVNVAFTFPMSIFGSILTAYERFVFPRVLQIVRILLNTVVMIALLAMGYKALALVVVQTVFNVLTLTLHWLYCRYRLRVKIRFCTFQGELLKEVSVYSFWVFLSVVMDRIYWSTGQFVLALYDGTGAVAVFSVAIQLSLLYMSFSTSISGVFLPRVTGMVTCRASDADISYLFLRTGRIQFMVMALVLTGFAVFGRSFVYLWAGPGYDEVYAIALLLFASLTVPMIQNLGITILQARNQMKFRSLLYLVIALASLFAQFLLARKYGGIGVAIAISGALLLGQGVVMNVYYHRCQRLDMRAFWREIGRMSIVPALVALGASIALQGIVLDTWMKLAMAIGGYLLVYVPLFYRFSIRRPI